MIDFVLAIGHDVHLGATYNYEKLIHTTIFLRHRIVDKSTCSYLILKFLAKPFIFAVMALEMVFQLVCVVEELSRTTTTDK